MHLICFSCFIRFLMKKKFIKYSNTMNIYPQHYQWFLIFQKEELNIKDGLTAIVKHIVETQTLDWKQLTKSLDMELYHLTKSLMQTFLWKQLFISKGRPWGGVLAYISICMYDISDSQTWSNKCSKWPLCGSIKGSKKRREQRVDNLAIEILVASNSICNNKSTFEFNHYKYISIPFCSKKIVVIDPPNRTLGKPIPLPFCPWFLKLREGFFSGKFEMPFVELQNWSSFVLAAWRGPFRLS